MPKVFEWRCPAFSLKDDRWSTKLSSTVVCICHIRMCNGALGLAFWVRSKEKNEKLNSETPFQSRFPFWLQSLHNVPIWLFCKNFSQKFNVVLKSAEFDAGFVSFGKNVRNYWKNIRGPRTCVHSTKRWKTAKFLHLFVGTPLQLSQQFEISVKSCVFYTICKGQTLSIVACSLQKCADRVGEHKTAVECLGIYWHATFDTTKERFGFFVFYLLWSRASRFIVCCPEFKSRVGIGGGWGGWHHSRDYFPPPPTPLSKPLPPPWDCKQ